LEPPRRGVVAVLRTTGEEMMSFTKIALGALFTLPLVLQPAFAQQNVDAARTQQQGVAATTASPPANTPPPARTGDGQVVNSNPTSGGGEGGGGKK